MNSIHLFKKCFVFGIMFLFISLGNYSSIGENIGNLNIKNINNSATGIPLNDNFVNAFWKFDECTGNILEDSSGNNYDGIIYDSAWVSGKSYCGLDFDGIDDYVDLDDHTLDLGFNKTDDLIFSLWFKTDSTNSGYIYCIAGDQHVPEALIEICQNGSFRFKVWTSVCGIEAFSNEGHNNDIWHQAEVYFNGITAKPTLEIYIDEELEGTKTRWLCEIEDSDFEKTKIGRRAQSETHFFDGQVDEFKIIKYPGGNNQNSPQINGPIGGYPNVEYKYTFTTEDPEEDDIWLTIDWGDTTFEDWFGPFKSGQEVIAGHKWKQDGTYEIKAKSKDYWDNSRWSDAYYVKIGNVPPDIPVINGPTIGGVGTLYEYELISSDPDGDDIYYYMDWGDGDNSGWAGPFLSGEKIFLNHSWNSPGTYNIRAKAKDTYYDESLWSESYVVTIVENNPPTIPTIDGPNKGKKGTPHTYLFTSSDSDGNDISYYIKWGDGTITNWSDFQSSGKAYSESHSWKKPGKYSIEVKAKDIYDAESNWAEFEVQIPRNRATYNILLYRIFEYFQIIQRLINLK